MPKPLISLTLAYSAGILLGHAFLYFPYSIAILIIAAAAVSAIFVFLGKLSFPRLLFTAIPGLLGMAAYIVSSSWLPADHYTRVISDEKKVHTITGKISSPLDRDPDRTAFVMRVQEIDGTTVSGRLRVSVRDVVQSAGYGDTIRVTGRLYKPGGFDNPYAFDYPAYLARSGIHRTFSVRSARGIEIITPGRGIFRTVQNWRERIRQSFLTSIPGPGSAVLQAMVLGEEGALTDELRDSFMAAGVTHIISISGSHLGMFAVICFGIIRLLMRLLPERIYHRLTLSIDPKKVAAWITLPLVIFYTLLAGAQVATVRSLIMIAAALGALILDRDNALVHSLMAAALLILIANPQALFAISFQLSFISVFCIGSVVLLWKELGFTATTVRGRVGQSVAMLVIISLSAGIATGPLVVRYFNQFSLAGVVSNSVVVPLAGIAVVPLGLFSGTLSLFTGDLPLAGLNRFFADTFIGAVAFFSRLPFAEFHPPAPGIIWLLVYAVLVLSLFRLVRERLLYAFKPLAYSGRIAKGKLLAIVLSALVLTAGSASAFLRDPGTRVLVPDVGQGDSALIQLAGGRNVLIDGGGSYDGRFDIGRRVLAPFLWNQAVRGLDLVVLSHPHPDHMNGLTGILKKFEVAEIWSHGRDGHLPGYEEFKRIVSERKIRHTIVSHGNPDTFTLGGAELAVLHPDGLFRSGEKKAYAAENDFSLVVRAAVEGRVLLFTGDIGTGAEKALLRSGRDVKCDVLKVAHHGSKSSSCEAFVRAARPSAAVMTVGKENRYRHPSDEVVQRYENIGARVYRTDRDGALLITIGNGGIRVQRWNDLKLRKVSSAFSAEQELANWKRMWLRKWEL